MQASSAKWTASPKSAPSAFPISPLHPYVQSLHNGVGPGLLGGKVCSHQPGNPTQVQIPVFSMLALHAPENMPNQARNQKCPILGLETSPAKNMSFSTVQKIPDLRSISQLQALHADSFLMDKLNPFWETELSYRCPKPSSKSPPGGGLRQSQEKRRRVAGLGRRQRTGNELLPFGQFPRAVPSSQTDWDLYSCLPGGVSMCVSSPKLQLERTVVQKRK